MSASTERRHGFVTKLLSGERLEWSLIGRLAVVLAAAFVTFATLSLTMPAAIGYFTGTPQHGIAEVLKRGDLLLNAVVLPLAATFLCLFGFCIREALRVAGPAYRLNDVACRLQELSVPRGVRVRKDDHLQFAVKQLSVGLERIHEELAALQTIARRADVNDPARAQAALTQLKMRLESFTLVTAAPECAVITDTTVAVADAVREPVVQ